MFVSQSRSEEEVMDTSEVEKFFAFWPEDAQKKETPVVRARSDEASTKDILITTVQSTAFCKIFSPTCIFSGDGGDGPGHVGSIHLHG